MAKVGVAEKKTVITVLTEGKKLTNELKRQLHPKTTSREASLFLVENILTSYENAIALLALIGNGGSSPIAVENISEPSISIEGSPRSDGSDQNSSKKRKIKTRWSEQVRVSSGAGGDDGYNWRKYGQKDILGANHPRAYYRCTHRHTQGCLATKQVQRVDEDPELFDVVYKGKHSCRQERPKQSKERKEEETMLLEKGPSLVKTESSSFSFPSTPIECVSFEPRFFPEPPRFVPTSYSFLSPATSESCFSPSPCPVNDFGIGHSSDSDYDLGEIISDLTPVTDFRLGDLDISMDAVNFESQLIDYFY